MLASPQPLAGFVARQYGFMHIMSIRLGKTLSSAASFGISETAMGRRTHPMRATRRASDQKPPGTYESARHGLSSAGLPGLFFQWSSVRALYCQMTHHHRELSLQLHIAGV